MGVGGKKAKEAEGGQGSASDVREEDVKADPEFGNGPWCGV